MAKAIVALAGLLAGAAWAADGGAKPPLTFGMAQPYGAEQARKAAPLIEAYLSKVAGGPVTVVVAQSAEALADQLATGKVDLAWITPLAFVRASQKNGEVLALSKAMRKGGSLSYRAGFIVKKGSALKGLADLKGQRVAWVSKSSASGYLFPRELLKKEGFDADRLFAGEVFAGDHPGVCKAVLEGRADVGATFASEAQGETPAHADGCEGAADQVTVLVATGAIPNEVIAARDGFDSRRVNEVLMAFGRMGDSADGRTVLAQAFQVEGWGVAVEGDFAPVLDLLRAPDAKARVAPGAAEKKPAPKKAGKGP